MAIDDDALAAEVRAAVAISGEGEAVVRVMSSRGAGPLGIDPRSATNPLRVVHVEPLSARLAVLGSKADAVVSVRLVASRRGADLAPSAKIGAYVDAILALRVAQHAGDDDAVLVDASGHLLEATTSNLFLVTAGGHLVTPPCGAIFPGLTRREVLRLAAAAGLTPEERPLGPDDLLRAREAFLTSSVREIAAIGRVDGRALGAGEAGPVTRRLREAYREAVAAP